MDVSSAITCKSRSVRRIYPVAARMQTWCSGSSRDGGSRCDTNSQLRPVPQPRSSRLLRQSFPTSRHVRLTLAAMKRADCKSNGKSSDSTRSAVHPGSDATEGPAVRLIEAEQFWAEGLLPSGSARSGESSEGSHPWGLVVFEAVGQLSGDPCCLGGAVVSFQQDGFGQ